MSKELRVLFIEDSEDDVLLLASRFAAAGYDLTQRRVDTAAGVRAALSDQSWDLILCDHNMPGFNSGQALTILTELGVDTPFIIVSGMIGEEAAVEAMRAGASDSLMKDKLKRLVPAAERAIYSAQVRRAHRHARLALVETEARLSLIAANIPGMIFQLTRGRDKSLHFTYVSEGCQSLLGVSASMLLERAENFLSLIVEDDRGSFSTSLGLSAVELSTWNWEGRVRYEYSGTEKWLNWRSTPRALDDGRVVWDGIVWNVTQSKLAESELRESRATLSQLTSHLNHVREEERKRLSREIHDDVGGMLTALKIDVAWIKSRSATESTEFQEKIEGLDTLIGQIMTATSRIARDLRPGILDYGLVASIEWLTSDFAKHSGISCHLRCSEEDIDLDPDVAAAVFRICQESLTNIAKHAKASEAVIWLARDPAALSLEIRDNGRGVAAEELQKPRAFGIIGMNERIRQFGGTLEIVGAPGGGTSVVVHLPLAQAGAAEKQMPLL